MSIRAGSSTLRSADRCRKDWVHLTYLRRFTRLALGFSKSKSHLDAAVGLFVAWYNFCRIHKTLRVTPAMQAGLTDHIWTVADLISMEETLYELGRTFSVARIVRPSGGADPTTFLGKKLPRGQGPGGLYVFSSSQWDKRPSDLLYIGSAHSTDHTNLRYRISQQVIAALGLGGGSGGYLLSKYCRKKNINPLDGLFVAWQILNSCPVPDERRLFKLHRGKLSSELLCLNEPPARCSRCEQH